MRYHDNMSEAERLGRASRTTGRVIPFRRPPRPAEDPDQFDEVTRARDQTEALVIRGLLEAHGIRVVVRTHVAPSVHPFTVGEQAEVQILVPRPAVAESRRLLAHFAGGPPLPRQPGPPRGEARPIQGPPPGLSRGGGRAPRAR
jgi:hypothetical protein